MRRSSIEGANDWQRFRNVTLPLMTPVIFFTIVMGVIDGFQYFDQAFVASNVASGQTSILGTPQNSLLFYSIYLYQWAFRDFNMGYAAAMAWVLFAATMVGDRDAPAHVAALGALRGRRLIAASSRRRRRPAPTPGPAEGAPPPLDGHGRQPRGADRRVDHLHGADRVHGADGTR